ncbi:lipoprotein, MAG6090 family [Mycoplasmopsis bovis]|uniref:lipoprotein, MAG6090 family n=1 Tax=Mycoplasmopsis bovis TaxID=28903 RepID=UPI003F78B8A8
MKKKWLVNSGMLALTFPLVSSSCFNNINPANKSDEPRVEDKKALSDAVKVVNLGEISKKDIKTIIEALVAKNRNLKNSDIDVILDASENKAVIKAKNESKHYSGEVVVTFSVKATENNKKPEQEGKVKKTKSQEKVKIMASQAKTSLIKSSQIMKIVHNQMEIITIIIATDQSQN